MDQISQNIVLIKNSRTAWPTYILMLFLSFLDNYRNKMQMLFFKKDVDDFEIVEHKTCWFLVRGAVPP